MGGAKSPRIPEEVEQTTEEPIIAEEKRRRELSKTQTRSQAFAAGLERALKTRLGE